MSRDHWDVHYPSPYPYPQSLDLPVPPIPLPVMRGNRPGKNKTNRCRICHPGLKSPQINADCSGQRGYMVRFFGFARDCVSRPFKLATAPLLLHKTEHHSLILRSHARCCAELRGAARRASARSRAAAERDSECRARWQCLQCVRCRAVDGVCCGEDSGEQGSVWCERSLRSVRARANAPLTTSIVSRVTCFL